MTAPVVRFAMLGAGGRMGSAIIRCATTMPGMTLSGALESAGHPDLGRELAPGVRLTDDLTAALNGADAAIDFSFHTATVAHAPRLADHGTPWVIGTTGLDAAGRAAVERAAERVPVVLAPNMSLGVNLLLALLEDAARALNGRGYDVEIVERHHRLKKDAPSGTALGLGEAVAKGFSWKLGDVAVHGRAGISPTVRPDQEIGFHAVRGGDFVGDHTVIFAGAGESIEFSHRATSRDTFAAGALRAAAWLPGQTPGLYTMKDVLGL